MLLAAMGEMLPLSTVIPPNSDEEFDENALKDHERNLTRPWSQYETYDLVFQKTIPTLFSLISTLNCYLFLKTRAAVFIESLQKLVIKRDKQFETTCEVYPHHQSFIMFWRYQPKLLLQLVFISSLFMSLVSFKSTEGSVSEVCTSTCSVSVNNETSFKGGRFVLLTRAAVFVRS